ncbi:IclR family transcriptional regulator [Faunimonas sp. B44]|uniref:IclR family transcriptional regulator n=1 Tax=Faunimonas sp. B44 TaxID=3461493 RepID=UPI0040444DCB
MPNATESAPAARSERIPTTLRLLTLLEEIVRLGRPVKPSDLSGTTDLPKPTLHRLFQTLEAEGYLQREPDGRSYSVGRRAREMAVATLSTQRVRTARLAIMRALAKDVGETCNFAIPDRESMVYLDRVETDWPLRVQFSVGTHVPLHCTAAGKLYLATLSDVRLDSYLRNANLDAKTPHTLTTPDALRAEIEKVRAQGFAVDNEEFLEGVIAFAVPLRDKNGRMPATIAFQGPTQRLSIEAGYTHLPRLKRAAEELSALL